MPALGAPQVGGVGLSFRAAGSPPPQALLPSPRSAWKPAVQGGLLGKTALRTTAWASSCQSKTPVDTAERAEHEALRNVKPCCSELRELVVAQCPPEQEGEQDGNPAARRPPRLGPADRPGLASHHRQPAPPAPRAELGVQDTADHPRHGRQHPVLESF